MIFYEEYARAGGPGRVGHHRRGAARARRSSTSAPTSRSERFLPPILAGEELWCQGYSEPNAGSDLANVATRAELDGDEWVIDGQKVWTSLAHWAQWCFVLCRTDRDAPKHKGISYLLVPMDQPGIEIRPIVQITGTSEFNEVFFDGARTAARERRRRGERRAGRSRWARSRSSAARRRSASSSASRTSSHAIIAAAQRRGVIDDPVMRQRLADAWIGLRIMRYNALRTLSVARRR